jgi:hypothetical protein
MDPYLEDPGRWPDVHHRLITIAGDLLTAQLRPKYYARIEERVYVSDENDPGRTVIVPELRIAEGHGRLRQSPSEIQYDSAVEIAEPLVVTTLIEDEIHEPRVEVIDRAARLVVAVIEVLSPTNKIAGSRGRQSYQQKRREVMTTPTHFVEIDLLRAGELFVTRELYPKCDYLVHVSRVGKRPSGVIWPIKVTQRLPVIDIPLRGGDPDAKLDLQAVLTTAYDRAAYDLDVDYRTDPVPPLEGETAEWARRLLAAKGLR